MKFEVVQQGGAWIVRRDGVEVGRHAEQTRALQDVSERLRAVERSEGAVSLAMRYETPE
jgi:hypothetical protein